MREDADLLELESLGDLEEHLLEIYGSALWSTGVIHVTAVWDAGAGMHVTLEINEETPGSHHDRLVLGLARARADAIITTGKILRCEPRLTHELVGEEPLPELLAAWRQEALGKLNPPANLVLTSGRDLDLDHPFFRGPGRMLVFTSLEGQWALESRAADRGVEVVGVEEPGIRPAIDFLRRELGAATISVEAGPSVSRQLYEAPLVVDELMLSVFDAPRIPRSVEGGIFLTRDELEYRLPQGTEPFGVNTPEGTWWLSRRWR